jgi:type 1 glutamine amidotransferase
VTSTIKTAVITGRHAFDVPAFHALFRSMPDLDFYMQDLDNLVADTERVFDQYDVFLFYNMHTTTPEGKAKATLERLGQSAQGIFVMHHALLAFPDWPFWSKICGIQDRSFEYYHDQRLNVEVVDPGHPITAGMSAWRMVDETYLMDDVGQDSHVLLTVDHPKSMRTIAWTRQFGVARVFCLASGHDRQTFVDPNYRQVVFRGIQWTAGRI